MQENYEDLVQKTSDTSYQSRCRNCGRFVTPDFRRVFGDNGNDLHACRHCSTLRSLRSGDGITEESISQR